MKKSDKYITSIFLLLLAGFIFACSGGTDFGSDNSFSYNENEAIIESGDNTSSSVYVEMLVEALRQDEPLENLYFQKNIVEGSIGTLGRFSVMALVDRNTMQVDFETHESYSVDVGFITNVDATAHATGDVSYTPDRPCMFVGYLTYSTVLGAIENAPMYRAFTKDEVAQAEDIIATEKATIAENKRREEKRENGKQNIMKLIVSMQQNVRAMADMEDDRRNRIGDRFVSQIQKLEQQNELWSSEWSEILNAMRASNIQFTEGNAESADVLKDLKLLLDRARKLNAQAGY